MTYKLIFMYEDITRKDTLASCTVIQGLDSLREWITTNEDNLNRIQRRLQQLRTSFPKDIQEGSTSISNKIEFEPTKWIDILAVTDLGGRDEDIVGYKIMGVTITPDLIFFNATPDIPLSIDLDCGFPVIKPNGIGVIDFVQDIQDCLPDIKDGENEPICSAPVKAVVTARPESIVIDILNETQQIVGTTMLENYHGKIRVLTWDTADIDCDPSHTIELGLDFTESLSEPHLDLSGYVQLK